MERTSTFDTRTPATGKHGRATRTVRRLLGLQRCWCARCILYRAGLYRKERIGYLGAIWLRTSVLGIRMGADQWIHDETA